jgi:chromate transporter
MADPAPSHDTEAERLKELAVLFLRLGTIAFGGPAAHIAMMQDEIVVQRRWLTSAEFLDMLAATNFIPGPNSTEMTIHIGYRRAGLKGLLVAGTCFIFPAAAMCMLIAALYVRFGQFPISQSMLYGVKPVVIAVVIQALFKLGRATIKTTSLALLTLAVVVALFAGLHELIALFGAGFLMGAIQLSRGRRKSLPMLALPPFLSRGVLANSLSATAAATTAALTKSAPLLSLFLVFLKIGSVLFGSGYVLLAFLRSDIVGRGWLNDQQLLDAIAVGQVTPGPVFTTATFIGYITAGPMGAILATLGIFVPAFFFVAISAPLLSRMRGSKTLGAFLDGLNVASLALMFVVTVELSHTAMIDHARPDFLAIGIALVSLALLIWRRVNSALLVLAGAALGVVRTTWLGQW